MAIAALLRTHSKICCTRSRRYFDVTYTTGIHYLHNNRDNLNNDLPPPDNGLLKELNSLGLDKYIVPLSDLGYFSLPRTTTSEIEETTNDDSSSPRCPIITDIKKYIDLKKKPHVVTPAHIRETNLSLPRQFSFSGNNVPSVAPSSSSSSSSSLFHYRFWSKLASLYVAVTERNLNLEEDIDFVFGGSVLYFLATGKLSDDVPNDNEKCIMTKIPGTDVVVINRHKIYTTNSNSIGSQLERIVCGGGIDDSKNNNSNQYSNFVTHLHLLDIVGVKVLMSSEIDALFSPDENTNNIPLEIKSVRYTKYYNRQEAILFQMISSASQYICEGLTKLDDSRRQTLCNLRIRSLMEYSLRPNIISKRKLIQHGENIRDSIEGLQKLCIVMKEGEVYELKYDKETEGNLTMIHSATITIDDLFPKKEVVQELMFGK